MTKKPLCGEKPGKFKNSAQDDLFLDASSRGQGGGETRGAPDERLRFD